MSNINNPPESISTVALDGCRAVIRRIDDETGNPVLSVTLGRMILQADNVWRFTTDLRREDLLNAAKLASEAHSRMQCFFTDESQWAEPGSLCDAVRGDD